MAKNEKDNIKITKKYLKIDEVLFNSESNKMNIYKHFNDVASARLWRTGRYYRFRDKLIELHTFLVQNKVPITPKKVKWLLKLPDNYKEILSNNPDHHAVKKLELLNFYFDFIETNFEDELLKTKEGTMLLYQKYYGVEDQYKANNIQINIGVNKLETNINAIEVKDTDINVSKALGVKNNGND